MNRIEFMQPQDMGDLQDEYEEGLRQDRRKVLKLPHLMGLAYDMCEKHGILKRYYSGRWSNPGLPEGSFDMKIIQGLIDRDLARITDWHNQEPVAVEPLY